MKVFLFVFLVFFSNCTSPAEPVEVWHIDTVYVEGDTVFYSGESRSSGCSIFWDVPSIQQNPPSDSLRFLWRYRVTKYDASPVDSVWAVGLVYTYTAQDSGRRAKLLDFSKAFVEAPGGRWDSLDYNLSSHWGGWFAQKYWPIDPGMSVEAK